MDQIRDEEAFWKSIEETESQPNQRLTTNQVEHLFFLMKQGDKVSKERASEVQKRHRGEIYDYCLDQRSFEGIQHLKDEYEETHGYAADRCRNCDYALEAWDKYCKCCGAKVEEDKELKEIRYLETVCEQMMYGPRPVGNYVCDCCGNKWGAYPKDKERYCPKCGKNAIHFLFRPGYNFFLDF